jgi:hypothetical protein
MRGWDEGRKKHDVGLYRVVTEYLAHGLLTFFQSEASDIFPTWSVVEVLVIKSDLSYWLDRELFEARVSKDGMNKEENKEDFHVVL